MKNKVKQLFKRHSERKLEPSQALKQAINNIPRITNETVAEHREEVLSGARKFIYPLQHSIHRIALISATIAVAVVVAFFVYTLLALYNFGSTSTFLYRVTQVIPFPIAKAGPDFVAYENYLFELRHFMHYYQTQQNVDFSGESGKQQLQAFRGEALSNVIKDAFVKQLARDNGIAVGEREVDEQIMLLRAQNRLGSSDQVFEDVLKEFWGWSIEDFRRELKQQILEQKVVSKLDTQTHERAANALSKLKSGASFADVAAQHSDDQNTKEQGGDYGAPIEPTNRELSPTVIQTLFSLEPGQVSEIVETPLGLEIIQVREAEGGSVRASHIFFAFDSVDTYIDPLKQEKGVRQLIHPETDL